MNAWLKSPESDRNLRSRPVRDRRLQVCKPKVGVLLYIYLFIAPSLCGYKFGNE